MPNSYLKVTYRRGRPFAAYLYLTRRSGDAVARSREEGDGLVVDYSADGRPLGIEVTDPALASVQRINSLLQRLHMEALPPADLQPICS